MGHHVQLVDGRLQRVNQPDRPDDPLFLRPRCTGAVRVEVSFRSSSLLPPRNELSVEADDWIFGLRLQTGSGEFYGLQLQQAQEQTGASNEQLCRLSLVKDQLELGQRYVTLKPGSHKLSLVCANGELQVKLDDRNVIQFNDVFPLTSRDRLRIGLIWSGRLNIESAHVDEREPAGRPSALELADDLFTQRKFSEALSGYRLQLSDLTDTAVADELQCKIGICLAELGQHDDAIEQFEPVAVKSGRWSIVAGCHLWEIHLSRKDIERADEVLSALEAQKDFRDVVSLVPIAARNRIIGVYTSQTSMAGLDLPNPNLVRNLERVCRIDRLLGDRNIHTHVRMLIRALRMAGHRERAIVLARKEYLTARNDSTLPWNERFVHLRLVLEQYAWMSIVDGRPDDALDSVDRCLLHQGKVLKSRLPLLITRARLYAAMDRIDDAENDMQTFFEFAEPGKIAWRFYSAAALVHGFLLEELGRTEDAMAAWQKGLYRNWPRTTDSRIQELEFNVSGFQGLLNDSLLLSLSKEMTDSDARRMTAEILNEVSGMSLGQVLGGAFPLPSSAVRDLWSTPLGRNAARRIALHTLSFSEFRQTLAVRLFVSVVRNGVGPNGLGADTEQFTTETGRDLYRWAMTSENVTAFRALQLIQSWKGNLGGFGWSGLSPTLNEPLRLRMAWLLALRLNHLGKGDDYISLLKTIVDNDHTPEWLRSTAKRSLHDVSN